MSEQEQSERDTRFMHSAMQVMKKMMDLHGYIDVSGYWTDEDLEEYTPIIARYAYDVAMHVISETIGGSQSTIEHFMAGIPDMATYLEQND